MTRTLVSNLAALSVLVSALALPIDSARAQSYPKLMTNGHGLALTRLQIQEKMAGNWAFSPSLRLGVQYRLVLRFTNFFPGQVNHITNLRYSVQVTNGLFFSSEAFSGNGAVLAQGSDVPGLKPGQSKTFYEYFKWHGPTAPTPLTNFKVGFAGSELHWLPNLSGQVRPGG